MGNFSIDMLNSIRNEASEEYRNAVPVATRSTLGSVGMTIFAYEVVQNEFYNALINKIGKTIIETALYKNKLARFKTGTIMTQQDVEEIFIGMGNQAVTYRTGLNDTEQEITAGLFKRKDPVPMQSIYHRMNRRDVYEFTIGELDFKRAFRSEATLDSFITGIFNAVYSRAEYDEYIHMKNLLARYGRFAEPGSPEMEVNCYVDYEVSPITDEATARAFVRTVRKASMDMSFVSDKCNKNGLMLATPVENQVLFINKDVLAHVDVDVLAKSFNLGKTDFQTDVVTLDDFGELQNTFGLLVDKDFFRVYDTYSAMKKAENGRNLYTNYFYHVQQILSLSHFKNAVRFTTNPRENWE